MNVLKYGIATVVVLAVAFHRANVPEKKAITAQQGTNYSYKPAAPSATVGKDSLIRERITSYAESLIGTPYRYASCDPRSGFDCSGFISYVFKRFGMTVPRSSVEFTNVGRELPVHEARRGDLILFTGTNAEQRVVGHMGIVVSNNDSLRFIHSSSGKEYSVIITPLNDHYRKRFMKVIRVFDEQGNLAL